MSKIIAYCGIICTECPAFIATKNNDDVKRKETAELWSKQFGHEMKPEDINCEGCTPDSGKKVGYCTVCEIRNCGREKKVVNCAYCSDYTCDKLDKFFQMAPMIKANLEEIRKGLKK
jgi:hypothetical protein